MSTQPATPVAPQQPPMTVVSSADLINQAIQHIPSLASVRSQLELVFGVYVQFVNSPTGPVKLEDAIADVQSFFETDSAGIRQAILDINRVIIRESSAIATHFKELTGAEIDPKTLDIAGRVKEEVEEQQSLDKMAREFLAMVQSIVAKLGVRDLYALAHQNAVAPAPVKKVGIFASLSTRIIDAANQAAAKDASPQATTPADQVLSEPEPNWLTAPVLALDSSDVSRIRAKLERINALMGRYATQANMKDLVLASLSNLGMPMTDLEELLKHASELAHKQLDQSAKILAGVDTDRLDIAESIQAVNDIKSVYGAVMNYFFPG